jgi:hypothetical protein
MVKVFGAEARQIQPQQLGVCIMTLLIDLPADRVVICIEAHSVSHY